MNQSAVFVNRILNMKKIKYIGLDMDHTLIRYHTEQFESLVFKLVVQQLVRDKQYPKDLLDLPFNFKDAIRGLVIDSVNGNILKLNRYGAIRDSFHGTKRIAYAEQKQFYRSTYVDLSDPNYMAVDTSFSIAFCALYGQLVDYKDKNPLSLPNYNLIALDILSTVDAVHSDGSLKGQITEQLADFVILDKAVVEGLKRMKAFKKKIFILTNSDYHYTKILLDFAINPFLEPHETWQDLFEYVITLANKPRFFYDHLPFFSVDKTTGKMSNWYGAIKPGIYQGGNAKKFTHDLALMGDEILYVGDHIYGDILRLKKDCNWRTALVVEELGAEIAAQQAIEPIQQDIMRAMKEKKHLEFRLVHLQTQSIDEQTDAYGGEITRLQSKLHQCDKQIAQWLKKQNTYFNSKWDRVFRAGAEESYFAYQVERYACIYMEKIADLLAYSPLTYFRAERRLLPHDWERVTPQERVV